jgi:hypothetical protein
VVQAAPGGLNWNSFHDYEAPSPWPVKGMQK